MYVGENVKQVIVNALTKHSNINQKRIILTSGYTMTVVKSENILNNSQLIYEGLTKALMPSFCNLIQYNNNNCPNYQNITIAV